MRHYTMRHIFVFTIFMLIALGILIYAYYGFRTFLSGPSIHITSPSNGITLTQPLITIEGTAENIARVELNNRQIFIDENKRFTEKLLLQKGYNIITIQAVDKFKRKIQSISK